MSGNLVDVLCGHPEQNQAIRLKLSKSLPLLIKFLIIIAFSLILLGREYFFKCSYNLIEISPGSNAPEEINRSFPSSSNLPTTFMFLFLLNNISLI